MADWFAQNAPKAAAPPTQQPAAGGGDWFAQNAPAPAPVAPKSQLDILTDSIVAFGKGAGSQLNPATMLQGMADMTAHPIDTATGMLQAQADTGGRAFESVKRGDYLEGVRHAIGFLLPVVGPQIDEIGNKAQAAQTLPEFSEAMGEAAGFGVANALPGSQASKAIINRVKVPLLPKLEAANQRVRQAVDYARSRNIPVSAATATQNKAVQGAQAVVDHSPGGASVAQKAAAQHDAAMTKELGSLADRTHASSVDPVQAGADYRGQVESNVGDFHAQADTEYSQLWEREKDPANVERVQVGTKKVTNGAGKEVVEPVYEDMGLPVDMKAVRKQIKPVVDQIRRNMPIAKQRMSEGYLALENIMNARDFEPASVVDRDLSAIKAAARGADLPELRSLSQGLAAFAVKHLDDQVQAAVSRAKVFDGAAPVSPLVEEMRQLGAKAKEQPARAMIEGKATPSGGAETSVSVPGDKPLKYKARYEVRELDDIQPSHLGQTFEPNPKYKLKNDRNYSQAENQRKVIEWSAEEAFDPESLVNTNNTATSGPIIIDSTGDALGGNGRTMILQRVFGANKEAAKRYRGVLESRLNHFGIDPKSIEGMRQPVLVRVIDDAELGPAPGAAGKQKAITDFNIKETAELTPSERAIADSRRVSPKTLDDIGARLEAGGSETTLAQLLEGDGGVEVFQRLVDDGVISSQETAAMISGKQLTKAGKDRIASLMMGRYFRDAGQLDTIPASIRGKMERLAAPLATVEASKPWNLSPHIQDAIELTERARTAGGTLDDFIKQGGLLVDQEYSPQAIALARELHGTNPNELVGKVRKYADHMHYEGQYEGPGLFGDLPDPLTPAAAFKDAFGVELPAGATMEPTPRAKPKFANFDEATVKVAPKRPTKDVGLDALGELQRGRRATVQKYEAADVLKAIRTEPRQAFDQLVYRQDSGIEFLNKVATQSPAEMPKIGRAVLEDLLEQATRDGGFDRAKQLANKWESLGPKTKRILYKDPKLIQDLDNFFLYAKKAAETPNPSGTAVVGSLVGGLTVAVTNPATGIPMMIGGAALAKLLHSPKFNAALKNGVNVRAGAGARSAMAASQILKIAGDAAKPAAAKPAAEDNPTTKPPRTTASGR